MVVFDIFWISQRYPVKAVDPSLKNNRHHDNVAFVPDGVSVAIAYTAIVLSGIVTSRCPPSWRYVLSVVSSFISLPNFFDTEVAPLAGRGLK